MQELPVSRLWINSVGTWMDDAACATADPELFFNPDGTRSMTEYFSDVKKAKQVCSRCPVVSRCLQYALEAGEHYGIWGGTTPRERRRMLHEEAAA